MKKKTILGVIGSVIMAASMVGSITASAATTKRISGVLQYPQEKNYWCGYSALQSAINNEYRIGNLKSNYNYLWTQSNVATYIDNNWSCIHPYSSNENDINAMPWYIGAKSVDTNRSNYPACIALSNLTKSFRWDPYGCSTTGNGELAWTAVKSKVMTTTDKTHAVLACGRSNPNGTSYMPGYPKYMVGHWIACDGYKNSGNNIWVVDPAANASCLSGFSCSAYYNVTVQKFTDFAWFRGILW